jgi:ADP-ribose pyrophosphatase YjhB (NUDIX family)
MVDRHVLCVGTLVIQGDACLLVRQSATASLAGRWSIPWGFVDEGETPDAAAERETLEEARVEVRVVGVAAVQVLPGEAGVGIVFKADSVGQVMPRPDGSETDDARFLTADEINELPVESWCRQLALAALAGGLDLLRPSENPYDLRLANDSEATRRRSGRSRIRLLGRMSADELQDEHHRRRRVRDASGDRGIVGQRGFRS